MCLRNELGLECAPAWLVAHLRVSEPPRASDTGANSVDDARRQAADGDAGVLFVDGDGEPS
eukprot:10277456-Lingulodinium_polyedra.AAC.1